MVNAGCFQSRQSGTNQVNHLRVIRVRDGREETGNRTSGREGRGMTETWSTGQNMDIFL